MKETLNLASILHVLQAFGDFVSAFFSSSSPPPHPIKHLFRNLAFLLQEWECQGNGKFAAGLTRFPVATFNRNKITTALY